MPTVYRQKVVGAFETEMVLHEFVTEAGWEFVSMRGVNRNGTLVALLFKTDMDVDDAVAFVDARRKRYAEKQQQKKTETSAQVSPAPITGAKIVKRAQ